MNLLSEKQKLIATVLSAVFYCSYPLTSVAEISPIANPIANTDDGSNSAGNSAAGTTAAAKPTPMLSARIANEEAIDNITRKILLKDIQLERANIAYRKAANVQGRWRGPRYFLSQEANNAATMAGLFASVAIREGSILHPTYEAYNTKGKLQFFTRRPQRAELETSFVPQMVGQFVGAYGSACELGVNLYHDQVARRHGQSPGAARKRAREMKTELKQLFAERDAKLAECSATLSPAEIEILKTQGTVLKDLCDLSMNEFVKFQVDTRRYRSFQDSLYVFDIAKNTIGAAGNIVAMCSLHYNRPHLNGPAGILTFMSGALITANPFLSRGVGKAVGVITAKRCKGLNDDSYETDLDKLKADREKLTTLCKSGDTADTHLLSQVLAVDALNETHSNLFGKKADMATREVRAGRRSATENIAAGTIIGGTKMALGVCAMVAGFRYPKRPSESNMLLRDGAIAYGTGSAIGVGDNIRIQVRNELERYKNGKRGLLPGQVLSNHLKQLDQLEASLKAPQK